jgi:hypothetical protein
MLSESLTIGLLLTLVFGALFFYVYSRLTYSEKRVGLIEKMLLNLKMEQDEAPKQIHMPQFLRPPPQMTFHQLSHPEPTVVPPPSPPLSNATPSPPLPHPEVQVKEVVEEQKVEEEEYQNILEEAHHETDALPKLEINYEAMTKEELIEVAKSKGIRVGNRPGREKLLQLLKKQEELGPATEVDI